MSEKYKKDPQNSEMGIGREINTWKSASYVLPLIGSAVVMILLCLSIIYLPGFSFSPNGQERFSFEPLVDYNLLREKSMYTSDNENNYYIQKVKNSRQADGKCLKDVASREFPDIPKSLKRWEYYICNGKKYVCHITRSKPGEYYNYLWEIDGDNIQMLREPPCSSIEKIDKQDQIMRNEYLKLSETERRVVEYFYETDAEIKIPEDMDRVAEFLGKRYKISPERVKIIYKRYNKAVSQ